MLNCDGILPSLVITDLDGTLLDSQDHIGRRTRKALNTVIESGVPIVVATGRPPRDLSNIISQLDFSPWCICANGAAFFDSSTADLEVIRHLSESEIAYCISTCKTAVSSAGFAVEPIGLETIFLCDENYVHPWEDPVRKMIDTADLSHGPAFKILVSAPDISSSELCNILRVLISDKFSLSYSTSWGLVEVSPLGINKAAAAKRLAQKLNFSTDRVLAFGDMGNDQELLLWAWRGVIMDNADPTIKGITPWSTASNNDQGVAIIIENIWQNFLPTRS